MESGDLCVFYINKANSGIGIFLNDLPRNKAEVCLLFYGLPRVAKDNNILCDCWNKCSIDIAVISKKHLYEFTESNVLKTFLEYEFNSYFNKSLYNCYLNYKSYFYDYIFDLCASSYGYEYKKILKTFDKLNVFIDRKIFYYKYNVFYHYNYDEFLFESIVKFVKSTKNIIQFENDNVK